MTIHVRVAANGRLVLPAAIRRRLGLEQGGALTIEETEQGVVLRTHLQGIRRAQAMSRKLLEGKPEITVADFVSERHDEARREERER